MKKRTHKPATPKAKLPKTTKRVTVTDPTGKKKPEFNVCVRLDADTSSQLITAARNLGYVKSNGEINRSQMMGHVALEFLDALPTMNLPDVLRAGRQKGQHPDEATAQWQIHTPGVVTRIKMLEQSLGISRTLVGRAACDWWIKRHPGLVVETETNPSSERLDQDILTWLESESAA